MFNFARCFFSTVGTISKLYTIQHKGLSVGRHLITFNIGDDLFARYPEGEVRKGSLEANVDLVKHSTMLELLVEVKGHVEVVCDRCLEPMSLLIEYEDKLIVKILSGYSDSNDEIWAIGENDHELDLAHYLYESISLSLPIQRIHGQKGSEPKECDGNMLKYIISSDGRSSEGEVTQIDPRWDKLKGKKFF